MNDGRGSLLRDRGLWRIPQDSNRVVLERPSPGKGERKRRASVQGQGRRTATSRPLAITAACCPYEGRQRAAMPARMAAEQWVQGSLTLSHALGF